MKDEKAAESGPVRFRRRGALLLCRWLRLRPRAVEAELWRRRNQTGDIRRHKTKRSQLPPLEDKATIEQRTTVAVAKGKYSSKFEIVSPEEASLMLVVTGRIFAANNQLQAAYELTLEDWDSGKRIVIYNSQTKSLRPTVVYASGLTGTLSELHGTENFDDAVEGLLFSFLSDIDPKCKFYVDDNHGNATISPDCR